MERKKERERDKKRMKIKDKTRFLFSGWGYYEPEETFLPWKLGQMLN